jgi:glutamate synthase domain-containing protein 2/glutamate synthase domain-containing protein 1/glutamate synthase domain-containing protein 3
MHIPQLPQTKHGLYDPRHEHDGCGVGVVANIRGLESHDIVKNGLEVLKNLNHRGACGCDPLTGDGAGILVQIPDSFMRSKASALGVSLPDKGAYGIGMIFLPQAEALRNQCLTLIQRIVTENGQTILGWREVPVDNSMIGYLAKDVEPVIKQVFIGKGQGYNDNVPFELTLYLIRKHIETEAQALGLTERDFYVPSLSSNKLVYKGLLMATQLGDYYSDLSDETFTSSFALVHSRFSTNTLGSWPLAHPYRYIAHNGEINTVIGNINWMHARESMFQSSVFGDNINKLFPVIPPNQSDTACLDNAVELLLSTGRSLPHVMLMLIPEAWTDDTPMAQNKKDFYEYHATLMEPWDGPALVAFTDGTRIGAILDRNGLRPFRYLVTKDDMLVMASETGVLEVPAENVLYKERLHPGRMFFVDPQQGRIVGDEEIKNELANQQPYGEWLKLNKITLADLPEPEGTQNIDSVTLTERQKTFGYTVEDLHHILDPMVVNGQEPDGSMGNDAPPAVLSDKPQHLFSYFKQRFAQVSNPPLDAIREELVTSLEIFIGSEQNLFEETDIHCQQLKLTQPIITNLELEKIRNLTSGPIQSSTLSTLFISESGSLEKAIDQLCAAATLAIEAGSAILILSDRGVNKDQAPIPSLLATAAVHHHLIRAGLRTKIGIVVESGEPRDVSQMAVLIGYGAGAINPYLAFETIQDMAERKLLSYQLDYKTAEKNFIKAIDKGLLKIISKMGISTIQSYRGAQIFEAIGLNSEVIEKYFTWTPSQIEGLNLDQIEEETLRRHHSAYIERNASWNDNLDVGGVYQWRRDGEYHMYNPDAITKLQQAARTNDPELYKQFASLIDKQDRKLSTFRGLLDFKEPSTPVPLNEVEPASEIVKRFATGAISLGAISREAHETLAIAMNRIGAKSNTGEGGEDFNRYILDDNGDNRNSAIKQVASGRFGVTTNYLVHATDLQIKMAQGSKPGEGGRLPGHKVDDYIGWIRHTTPGVELISPPPHHDIYSIEDLAQLIHDLKNVNPEARIHVKLVSEIGVGTIAAGVSKGHGDVVLISADSGGTGASPESSIKQAGLPWELGLAETQQVLVMNNLRGRIVVQTDGQLKTGRDVAVACLLGAEEFGFATAALVTLGCIMLRKCHLNACSVGIATQDPELRKRFAGKPEHVINYFMFIAEHLREIMANMGFRTINEMVGRVDKLEPRVAIDHWKAKGLDFSNLLMRPEVPDDVATYCTQAQDHGLELALDNTLIKMSQPVLDNGGNVSIDLPISNSNRTVGAMLSGQIAKLYGENGLPDHSIDIKFKGSAGQSFGAFVTQGINITLEGDANDYVGKGMSGGVMAIYPPKESTFTPELNIIIGNVALYGATGGKAYFRGLAGERFCVRNSGALTVVEGVGDHACEYMTGGIVVVLGDTGRNFAAGMSGGMAFIYDEAGTFSERCNAEMVDLEGITTEEDANLLKQLVSEHATLTGSSTAQSIIDSWEQTRIKFVKVMPRDYRRVLEERKLVANTKVGSDG